jgi:hypothetical protein
MQNTFNHHAYRILLTITFLTLGIGVVVYHFVEHFTWLNAYYFSVVTLATVGYGDLTPHTPFGKIFTTFYIFIGVGILTTFITYTMKRSASRIEDLWLRKPTLYPAELRVLIQAYAPVLVCLFGKSYDLVLRFSSKILNSSFRCFGLKFCTGTEQQG